jgi:hypothetical protein
MEGNACDQLRAQPWIVGEVGPPMNADDALVFCMTTLEEFTMYCAIESKV